MSYYTEFDGVVLTFLSRLTVFIEVCPVKPEALITNVQGLVLYSVSWKGEVVNSRVFAFAVDTPPSS